MALDSDAKVSTAIAAQAVKVPPERVRKWASRGWLTAVARTKGGWPLYRLGDVYDLQARIAARVLAGVDDHVSRFEPPSVCPPAG